MTAVRWGTDFDPDRLALLELRTWKAYYRRQPARLFGNLVLGLREQGACLVAAGAARVVLAVEGRLSASPVRPATTSGSRRTSRGATGRSACRPTIDAEAVAREELRWWVVRREIGLSSGAAAGATIARLYAAVYGLPESRLAEAGRLRGLAAEVRDRGATADPDGPKGRGATYWPEVVRLLRESYRSLSDAVTAEDPG